MQEDIYEVSLTWLSKYDLDKHDIGQAERGRLRRPQPYTRNYRKLRNVERGRHSLSQQRAQQLIIRYQMVSLENIYKRVTLYRLNRFY